MRKMVGQGSTSSLPLNTIANRGSTNVSRKIVVPIAIVKIVPG